MKLLKFINAVVGLASLSLMILLFAVWIWYGWSLFWKLYLSNIILLFFCGTFRKLLKEL